MSFTRNRGLRRTMVGVCTLSAAIASTLGYTQEKSADDKLDEVIVTGSRIARPNLESTVPVTTVGGEELFETGSTSVGDLLNDLPSIRSTISQSNSSRFLGTTGLNLLDLRGLGTQRTLVLVNGRRHVGSDILNNAVSPDINTFPTDLVERIDVVTGGNSAVYGSDAIAGVVNFVLKKDFEGLQFRGQGGQSDDSDGTNYYGSVLAGTNFWDDRGNIAMNLEYAKQDAIFASNRPNLKNVRNFVLVDADPAGQSSDGVADRLFFDDIRTVSVANGGLVLITNNAMMPNLNPCGRDAGGARFNCTFVFQPDGTLVPQTGARIGVGPSGAFLGGNGDTTRGGKMLGIFPDLDRMSFNVIGHLAISDAFVPFVEAKYVRTESTRWGSPAFFQGATIDGDREQPRFDNPFLSSQAQATIQAGRAAAGLAPLAPTAHFALRKNLEEFGGRQEDATRETTRIVLGVGGDIGENWNYEVALNYGKFEEDTLVYGNIDVQRFALAMDSARDGTGTIRCRSQIDPAAAYAYDDTIALGVARLPTDISSCVPLNPFGFGSITQAMRDYVLQDTTSVAEIKQTVVSASMSGSTAGWFELPAGPIGIAFGLERRTEENFFQADELVSASLTFYNALPLFEPPKQTVNEVFTELRVPLLKEKTAFEELTVSLAGRYADYSGAVGGVMAYNAGLDWAPVKGLRFRGGKARAVRAPNLVDLFSEQSQNFAAAPNDPCSLINRSNGSPTRAANCAAAGIPAGYDYRYTASIEIVSGGNPQLKEETSDSLTYGVVFQPEFIPGFSMSVDYYDITIDDVITAPSAQDIMNACYDAATLNNQFCGLFTRNGAGVGPTNEDPYQILQGSLQQTSLNYAKSVSRGIDVDLTYSTPIADSAKMNLRMIWTHTLQRDEFLDPVNPGDADQILLELGDPRDAFNFDAGFQVGKLDIGYQLRYIGPMVLNNFEDTYSVQGNPPQNPDYAFIRKFPSVFYHDIRAAYDVTDGTNVYLGVDNLADKDPPYGLTGTTEGGGIFEAKGRFFYAGVKVKF